MANPFKLIKKKEKKRERAIPFIFFRHDWKSHTHGGGIDPS